jgi:hypothetical protein
LARKRKKSNKMLKRVKNIFKKREVIRESDDLIFSPTSPKNETKTPVLSPVIPTDKYTTYQANIRPILNVKLESYQVEMS